MTVERSAARAAARLAKHLDLALGDLDLSLPQYRALAFLSEGGAAPSDLAGQLLVSKPSITALVDGLVARGLVARTPDEHDRRRVEHQLTPAGEAALDAADEAVVVRLSRLADHLEPADRSEAERGLASWNRALDAARRQAVDAALVRRS